MFHRAMRRLLYRISRLCQFIGLLVLPVVLSVLGSTLLSAQDFPTIASGESTVDGMTPLSGDYDRALTDGSVRCDDDPFCFSATEPFVLLPKGFIYPTYLADPNAPRLGTQLVHEQKDGWLWDSTLGGRVGLFRWGPADYPSGVQLDLLAAAKLRMDPHQESDVRSVDYLVNLPLTWDYGPHKFKFGYSHLSSHLGDEFLLKNPGFNRLNYVRDSLLLGYSYYPTPYWRLYGEASYSFYRKVADPWGLTFGVEYAPTVPTGVQGAPFAAVNTTLRQEVNFSGGLSLQAGWSWRSTQNPSGLLRTGLYYYNGKSPQYSFFNQFEQQLGWGIWYDF